MKFLTGLLSFILLFAGAESGGAAVRIVDDRGGMIGSYIDKYEGLRRSGQVVMIDGQCASACTIVLGKIPHDKICVTSNAALAFHAAFDFGSGGQEITNRAATKALYSMYPLRVQRWISRQGGLTPHLIVLRGAELAKMYRPCDMNAWAALTIEPRVLAARRAVNATSASEGKAGGSSSG
jgi:hypothetical protein